MKDTDIKVDYQQLEDIARMLDAAGEQTEEALSRLKHAYDALIPQGWKGEGAGKFSDEMDQKILPRLKQLGEALGEGGKAVREISEIFYDAETRASNIFNTDGSGAIANAAQQGGAAVAGALGNNSLTGGPVGPTTSGKFSLGSPSRPDIYHDGGYLAFCSNNPDHSDCSTTARPEDYLNRAKYEAMLRGAQLAGHLDDGTQNYQHYLYGDGKDLNYDYGEFIAEDKSGQAIYKNMMIEAQKNAEIIGQGRSSFSITSQPYAISLKGDPRFPYPETENWRKAIGAHQLWTSADVKVSTNAAGQRVYTMDMTYNAEDRYNFNPNEKDMNSRSLDRENGRFEVVGWSKSYMSYGTTKTTVTWTEGDVPGSAYTTPTGPGLIDRSVDTRSEIGDR